MNYPTIEQVKSAPHIQICKWHRFLPSPRDSRETLIINKIYAKFIAGGGMTEVISKSIGWGD